MTARDRTEGFIGCIRRAAERKGVAPPKTLVIKKRQAPSSAIAQHAQNTLESISQCQAAIEARAAQYLHSTGGMTNQEKDQSDADIAHIIKSVHRAIKELEEFTANEDVTDTMKHHRGQVKVVQAVTRETFEIFREQKSFRKHQVEQLSTTRSAPTLPQDFADGSAQVARAEDAQGTSIGQQQLHEENASLLAEMLCLNSQVEDVQKRMMEIAELSAQFRSEIIQQSATIDQIHELTEQSTYHMGKGNETMEEVIKDGFSFRLMMVVFLFVASACILFLDWYQ